MDYVVDKSKTAVASNESSHDVEQLLRQKLGELPITTPNPYIYQVPENLRKTNVDAYKPFRVSIGPYHAANPKLKPMEEYKLRCLESLVTRSSGSVTLKDYVKVVASRESEARHCYARVEEDSDEKLTTVVANFTEMLVVDGAFVVEFFCRVIEESSSGNKNRTLRAFISRGGHVTDPISSNARKKFEVCRDLLLLENQLPFFVLEELFKLTFGGKPEGPTLGEIAYYVLKFLIPVNSTGQQRLEDYQVRERVASVGVIMHLVHLMRLCCLPFPSSTTTTTTTTTPPSTPMPSNCGFPSYICGVQPGELRLCCLRVLLTSSCTSPGPGKIKEAGNETVHHDDLLPLSVTEYHEAGVRFKKAQDSRPLLNIRFEHGFVVMPHLILHECTETFFRNLMAFEQYSLNEYHITDYMYMMDRLIDTTKDVDILEKSNVLENLLESTENVTTLFNNITKHTITTFANYKDVTKQMNAYAKRPWNKWMAMLRRDYFGSPWAVASFVAALVLLVLTVVQTIASVRSTEW